MYATPLREFFQEYQYMIGSEKYPNALSNLCLNPNATEQLYDQIFANPSGIDWSLVSRNQNTFIINTMQHYTKEHPEFKLSESYLAGNPSANQFLYEQSGKFRKLDWQFLSMNPSKTSYNIMNQYQDMICMDKLAMNENPDAIELMLLLQEYDEICWKYLCKNPNAMNIIKSLVKNNPEKVDWSSLSQNPNYLAIKILKQKPEKINWNLLSANPNPLAVELLKQNPEKINWTYFSTNENPEAIKMLEKNEEKIDFDIIWTNPGIFQEQDMCRYKSFIFRMLYDDDFTADGSTEEFFEEEYEEYKDTKLEKIHMTKEEFAPIWEIFERVNDLSADAELSNRTPELVESIRKVIYVMIHKHGFSEFYYRDEVDNFIQISIWIDSEIQLLSKAPENVPMMYAEDTGYHLTNFHFMSGWFDHHYGIMSRIHDYFKNKDAKPLPNDEIVEVPLIAPPPAAVMESTATQDMFGDVLANVGNTSGDVDSKTVQKSAGSTKMKVIRDAVGGMHLETVESDK